MTRTNCEILRIHKGFGKFEFQGMVTIVEETIVGSFTTEQEARAWFRTNLPRKKDQPTIRNVRAESSGNSNEYG